MYLTYNEGKSVVTERFIRTQKNKIFKYMTAIPKNVYFDVLDDIAHKYNNTVHRTIKMKPIDVKDNTYAEYNEDLLEVFMKKNYQKTNQKEFRIEKVFKSEGDKLYLKWKGYDNSFNSWIDKKDLI